MLRKSSYKRRPKKWPCVVKTVPYEYSDVGWNTRETLGLGPQPASSLSGRAGSCWPQGKERDNSCYIMYQLVVYHLMSLVVMCLCRVLLFVEKKGITALKLALRSFGGVESHAVHWTFVFHASHAISEIPFWRCAATGLLDSEVPSPERSLQTGGVSPSHETDLFASGNPTEINPFLGTRLAEGCQQKSCSGETTTGTEMKRSRGHDTWAGKDRKQMWVWRHWHRSEESSSVLKM